MLDTKRLTQQLQDIISTHTDANPEALFIYEAHVDGLTINNLQVPVQYRGKFLGICHDSVISHLKNLGVNVIQLQPVFASSGTYWGYDPTSWFDLNPSYGTLDEFKFMLKKLQVNGIKVILDVVYNHVDNASVEDFKAQGVKFQEQKFTHNGVDHWWNPTGCGNAVDAKASLPIILDSMNYWANEVGVDGFRFDLAHTLCREYKDREPHCSNEPPEFNPNASFLKALEQFKDKILMVEPWDCYGYSLHQYPDWLLEINGEARDKIRTGGTYYCGDFYKKSINFVTCHDGFTLHDLVSYNQKHNEINGENNRDGSDQNFSYNHGVEGPTDNDSINESRLRTMIDMAGRLLYSSYHVMWLMGDEFGRTQNGNNNGYKGGYPVQWPQ